MFGPSSVRHLLDTRFVLTAVLVAVLFIVTLRSILAPLYLLASVILSCAAARPHHSVLATPTWPAHRVQRPRHRLRAACPVGADYNILLMTRMREHGLTLTRDDVARAVTATRPVITSAGVIFASAFIALVGSSIHGLAQSGFAIATGLLLDTVIVRTHVVPACAALLGDHNWWPTRARPRPGQSASAPTLDPGDDSATDHVADRTSEHNGRIAGARD